MISLKSHMKLKDTKAMMRGPSTSGEVLVVNHSVGVGGNVEDAPNEDKPVLLQQSVDYDQYPDDAQPIKCNYRDTSRPVHPSACLWHRVEKDPECFRLKCPRVNLKMVGA